MRKAVGARELKTHLGGYIRQVQQGTTIVVTERGHPVAELRPLPNKATGERGKLQELVHLGLVTRSKTQALKPFRPVRSLGPTLSEAVLEDREDRL